MTYPLPIRTGGESAALHVDDHNEIHDLLGLDLSTTLTTASTGHLVNTNLIHAILNTTQGQTLPTAIAAGAAGHLSHHNTIHALLNTETFGIRGTVGQRTEASVPGFPTSGLVTVAPGAGTIQSAITANGNGTRFYLQAGTYTVNSEVQPKAGQQFWGQQGAIISGGGLRERGFVDVGSRNGVKIMNLQLLGFIGMTYNNRACIFQNNSGSSADWEIGYCTVSGDTASARYGIHTGNGLRTWVHHCAIHDFAEGALEGFAAVGQIVEDNEWYNAGGSNGNKWLACDGDIVRHNYVHDNNGTGIWFDTVNRNCIVEWNIVEANASNGIEFEISGNYTGSLNTVRYNHVLNQDATGIFLSVTRNTEVHGNIVENNGVNTFIGNAQEIGTYVKGATLLTAPTSGDLGYDLADNEIHHNYIRPRQTAGGSKAATMNWSPSDAPANTTPYLTNTKDNTWHHNVYDLRALPDNHFRWGPNTDNRAWASWQGVPQDASSTAS